MKLMKKLAIALAITGLAASAKKIHDYSATTSLTGSSILLVDNGSGTYNKVTAGNLLQTTLGAGLTVGPKDDYDFTIQSNGNALLTVKTGGNVGIGTASPDSKLAVTGNIKAASSSTALVISQTSLATGASGFQARNSSDDGIKMYSYSPSYSFGSVFSVGANGSALWSDNSGVFSLGTTTGSNLNFFTNNSNRMTVTSGGNVGIGTTSPAGKLHITNSSASEIIFTGGDTTNIYQSSAAQNMYINTNNGSIFMGADGSGSQATTITQAGNFGIGTASPDTELEIEGGGTILHLDSDTDVAINIDRSASTKSGYISYQTADVEEWVAGVSDADLQGDGSEYFIGTDLSAPMFWIETNGDVGIGTTTPVAKLQVNGDLALSNTTNCPATTPSAGAAKLCADSNGSVFIISNGGALTKLN